MDSRKDSTPMKNSLQLDSDAEKNWNCKNAPVQSSAQENSENVLTSVTSQISEFVPLNGPGSLVRLPNTTTTSDTSPQSNKLNEANNDSHNIVSGAESNVNNWNTEHAEPIAGSSRAPTHDNGSESSPEATSCQRLKGCLDKAGKSSAAPSTSGSSKACDSSDNYCRENRKRPSSLKLNRPDLDADESSSDTGNDDYSLGSEDGCIYTYRGGEHLADLPSSFFSLDMGVPLDINMLVLPNAHAPQQGAVAARDQDSRASSPDMDFLEMDFDPGPSCEVDTGDEYTPDAELEAANIMPEEVEPVARGTSPEYQEGARYNPVDLPTTSTVEAYACNVPSTSRGAMSGQGDVAESVITHTYGPYITHVNARGEQLLVRRTMSHDPVHQTDSLHVSSGDLVSPREMLNYDEENPEGHHAHQINQGERPAFDSANLSSALYHLTMAKKLMAEKTKTDVESHDNTMQAADTPQPEVAGSSTSGVGCAEAPRCMVWSEREACERQVTQIGTSACGATAVVNVFIALGVPVNIERINSAVGTRQRANNAPLPRYLLSRAVAGCTAADLVTGIQTASDGLVTARFFPTYPERAVSLSHWLADWISLGAVPILTLNLQVCCEGEVPDAWHHQMVFGVSSRGIYLCNPVECVREAVLWPRLASPSVLLVKTRDVLARFTANTDLTPLMVVPDRRFHTFNVLGQVVNAIREWRSTGWTEQGTMTRHIRLPAAYQAGVTVAALTGSEAHRRLMHAPQLPILSSYDPA